MVGAPERGESMVGAPEGGEYSRWRWLVFSVFVLASLLNYLDRAILNQLSPLILHDLHFNKAAFGELLAVAAIVYALASLGAGWLLDRWGVNRSMVVAVGWWSLAGIATAFVRSFSGLVVTRSFLALGESAGIPAVSKVNALYLKPHERALGTAINGLGLSLGLAATVLFVNHDGNWRRPFVITGLLSLLWIPLWLVTSWRFPHGNTADSRPEPLSVKAQPATEPRRGTMAILVLGNMLWMGAYLLWTGWTTFYFMGVYHLTLPQSARYTWIPPLVSNAGGLFGGWLSARMILRGRPPLPARQRCVWLSATAALLGLLLPWISNPVWGTVLVSWSFFFALAGSVNVYAMAIDLYGAAHTGKAVAAITCGYGLLQALISPVIGKLADIGQYQAPVVGVTLALLASAAVLQFARAPLISGVGHTE